MEKHLLIIHQNNLMVGDRIVVPKSNVRWVQHHVIFLGWLDGDYWIIENKEGIGVRTITARDFFKSIMEITRIERFKPTAQYDRHDLVRFALSLRKRKYFLFGYNCESFCNHVQHGKIESSQAKLGIGVGVALALLTLAYFSNKRK